MLIDKGRVGAAQKAKKIQRRHRVQSSERDQTVEQRKPRQNGALPELVLSAANQPDLFGQAVVHVAHHQHVQVHRDRRSTALQLRRQLARRVSSPQAFYHFSTTGDRVI